MFGESSAHQSAMNSHYYENRGIRTLQGSKKGYSKQTSRMQKTSAQISKRVKSAVGPGVSGGLRAQSNRNIIQGQF